MARTFQREPVPRIRTQTKRQIEYFKKAEKLADKVQQEFWKCVEKCQKESTTHMEFTLCELGCKRDYRRGLRGLH